MQQIKTNLKKYEKDDLNIQLEKEYKEAIKDQEFKKFIDQFYETDKVLSKYTSSLEDSFHQFQHCKKCKGLAMCQNEVEGYVYFPKENNHSLEFSYKACKYKVKHQKETEYLKNIEVFDIPKEIREAKMKDILLDYEPRFDTIEWLNQFVKGYQKNPNLKGLYLYGNFGCGKTYLISAAFHELAKKGIHSAIIFWPEFLRSLKGSFGNDFAQKLDHIQKVPLLFIDDIGAENTTAWGRDEIFCPIIQYRMQEKLPTFFTSNLDLEALEQHFSITKDGVDKVKARRIIERIKQLTEVQEMISKNLRD